ncbi:MAG: hypothetical protein ACTSV5_11075 [Promethearchaeota archaeon]
MNDADTIFKKLHEILNVLEKFKYNKNKKLNLNKLTNSLQLPPDSLPKISHLIVRFQKIFNSLEEHELELDNQGNIYYFSLTKKILPARNKNLFLPPKTIILTEDEANILNDMIYFFKKIRRGVGFDISSPMNNKRICQLLERHPYFFFKNGNDLYYPSQLALSLGQKLLTYKKSHRPFHDLNDLNVNEISIKITATSHQEKKYSINTLNKKMKSKIRENKKKSN